MSDVPMPRDLTEEAVAKWLYDTAPVGNRSILKRDWAPTARAVLALVEAKVREGVEATKGATDPYCECSNAGTGGRIHIRFDGTDAIVARVMGKEATNG